jgi:hypothetical protein
MRSTAEIPPSPYRLPITILSAILGGPLALVVWIWLSGSQRVSYFQSNWLRAGVAVIAVGSLPLMLTILATDLHLLTDPNPNPVGFGVLFFLSVLLGSVLVLAGMVRTDRQDD